MAKGKFWVPACVTIFMMFAACTVNAAIIIIPPMIPPHITVVPRATVVPRHTIVESSLVAPKMQSPMKASPEPERSTQRTLLTPVYAHPQAGNNDDDLEWCSPQEKGKHRCKKTN